MAGDRDESFYCRNAGALAALPDWLHTKDSYSHWKRFYNKQKKPYIIFWTGPSKDDACFVMCTKDTIDEAEAIVEEYKDD